MADCSTCKAKKEQVSNDVPFIVHEAAMARAERTAKRLWITVVLLALLLVGTNGAWIWYESQYEDFYIEQDCCNGDNNYIGNDGDIYNGSTSKNCNPQA